VKMDSPVAEDRSCEMEDFTVNFYPASIIFVSSTIACGEATPLRHRGMQPSLPPTSRL
jgi:hypothetical protein